jgi:hypothetical protein
MVEHVRAQSLPAAHGAEFKMCNQLERVPVAQSEPDDPSQQEIETHGLAHEPFQALCPLCVQYRAKQNPHKPSAHESSGHSVLSMDFGFCSREEDESNKLTCLFLHDRATQMMAGIPTPQKGGKWLQYLTTEVVRFVVLTQHQELAMKTNRGPSILAL